MVLGLSRLSAFPSPPHSIIEGIAAGRSDSLSDVNIDVGEAEEAVPLHQSAPSSVKKPHRGMDMKVFWACCLGALLLVLVATLLLITFLQRPLIAPSLYTTNPDHQDEGDACAVFCRGPILRAVQEARLVNDSKTFVDRPLRVSPNTVLEAWARDNPTTRADIQLFLDTYFSNVGDDVLQWVPGDWTPDPPVLSVITNDTLRTFIRAVHHLWLDLGKQIDDDVYQHPNRHTLLPLKHKTMMVPGGRFREFYYWDSYWIVRGLLVSRMPHTARMVIENLLDLVVKWGFVPNGSRRYYLTRSQPPFLALMVSELYAYDGDLAFVREHLPTLRAEYKYWTILGKHSVEMTGRDGGTHVLCRYYSNWTLPRPESYWEDVATASLLNVTMNTASAGSTINQPTTLNASQAQQKGNKMDTTQSTDPTPSTDPLGDLFANIVSGAESGWDFSSRWFSNHMNLSTAVTRDIIPADLNSILYKVEIVLRDFHAMVGDQENAAYFKAASERRKLAIFQVLWDPPAKQWRDFNFKNGHLADTPVASDFVPLWSGCLDPELYSATIDDVAATLASSSLIQPGGITTSLLYNGQQWDYPVAWAPIHHMIIEGLTTNVSFLTPAKNYSGFYHAHYERAKHGHESTYHNNGTNSTEDEASEACAGKDVQEFGMKPSSPSYQLGFDLARVWVTSNFVFYNGTQMMLEKYDARVLGGSGEGGEYLRQTGFGWSNGVLLILVNRWPTICLTV